MNTLGVKQYDVFLRDWNGSLITLLYVSDKVD